MVQVSEATFLDGVMCNEMILLHSDTFSALQKRMSVQSIMILKGRCGVSVHLSPRFSSNSFSIDVNHRMKRNIDDSYCQARVCDGTRHVDNPKYTK